MNTILKRSIVCSVILALCFTLMAAFTPTEVYSASKIHLKKTSIELRPWETYQQKLLGPTGKAINASRVKWSSSNSNVARISSKGKVTAISAGRATLKAKYKGKTYKFKVRVWYIGVDGIPEKYLDGAQNGIYAGEGFQIIVRDENNKKIPAAKIKFSSSNTSVLTIDSNGYATAVTKGFSNITITYKGVKCYFTFVNVLDPNNSSSSKDGSLTCKTALPHVCVSDSGVLFRVDSISGKLEYKGKMISLSITGTCTGILGNRKEGTGRINYRLYDSEGFVVATGSFPTGTIRVGDKIKLQKSIFPAGYNDPSITNLIDDYEIEIYGDTED